MTSLKFLRPLLALVLCTISLAACGGPNRTLPSEWAPKEISGPDAGYLLEPGNRVRVTVFNEPAMSGDFVIDPNGSVAIPLVGNVRASGLTATELSNRVEEALVAATLLKDPQVSTEVQTYQPFYVLGEVRTPGEFAYTSGATVLSAIARAGGYDYRARQGEVALIRRINGKQEQYRADEMTPILPGDIIRVLETLY